MQIHLNQAAHNHKFLELMETHFEDSFYDWKITVLFYVSLHYLRAYQKFRNVRVPNTHRDMIYHCDPSHRDAINPLSERAFEAYNNLFYQCSQVRYNGFLDNRIFVRLTKLSYIRCKQDLSTLINYFRSNGLPLE